MPLKHAPETAFLLLLGVVIILTGVLTSLLPHLPDGLFFWAAVMFVTILYPLALRPTFKANRADYEFRLLHWYPAGIALLWIVLELLAPSFKAAVILELGFFFLWTLPLVFLGILLLILFALNVLRRSTVRVTALTVLMVLFGAGSLLAESSDFNDALQRTIYPKNRLATLASSKYAQLIAWGGLPTWKDIFAVRPESGTSSNALSSSASSRSVAVGSAGRKSDRLPRSGPGEVGLLALLTLSLYTTVLHRRAERRSS